MTCIREKAARMLAQMMPTCARELHGQLLEILPDIR
jgi:hypothetical protein